MLVEPVFCEGKLPSGSHKRHSDGMESCAVLEHQQEGRSYAVTYVAAPLRPIDKGKSAGEAVQVGEGGMEVGKQVGNSYTYIKVLW